MKTCGKVGGKSDGEMSHIKKGRKTQRDKKQGKNKLIKLGGQTLKKKIVAYLLIDR